MFIHLTTIFWWQNLGPEVYYMHSVTWPSYNSTVMFPVNHVNLFPSPPCVNITFDFMQLTTWRPNQAYQKGTLSSLSTSVAQLHNAPCPCSLCSSWLTYHWGGMPFICSCIIMCALFSTSSNVCPLHYKHIEIFVFWIVQCLLLLIRVKWPEQSTTANYIRIKWEGWPQSNTFWLHGWKYNENDLAIIVTTL